MAWTNVPKPIGPTYTKIATTIFYYDEPSLIYDDSTSFYDGFNPFMYTKIAKPTTTSYTNIPKPT